MKHTVYILKNDYNKYYVGHTSNLQLRLEEHNSGNVIATKKVYRGQSTGTAASIIGNCI